MSTSKLQQTLLTKIENGLRELDLPAEPVTLYEPYRYALSVGGKRIRPLLTLLSCGLCSGDIEEAMPAALAVEILHNFTLVHDDIMDSAETRRGQASVVKKWNENVAILSGDLMFADAYKKLGFYGHSNSFSKEEFTAIHEVFLKTTITVCEGQALDMEFVERNSITHDDYLEMIGGKTAALLSGALEMGAIAAHAISPKRKELSELGYEMGIAFQAQDDLLDAIADPDKFGKRPGGDIFEGKKTYLTILALERAKGDQAALIRDTLKNETPDQAQVNKVLELLHNLKVIEDVAGEVNRHYEKALELLQSFSNSPFKKELEKLLIFLKNRDH
ncbi:MAG: polyprenyl synthetase family protein [Balneolaceae bacterium]